MPVCILFLLITLAAPILTLQFEGQRAIVEVAHGWRDRVRRHAPGVSGRPHSFDRSGRVVQPPRVSSLVQRNKVVAKRKGAMAAATAVGGAVIVAAGAPVLGVIGLAGAAYLAWDWFSFRVKNGMRF